MSEDQRPPGDQDSTELPPTHTAPPTTEAGENIGPYHLLHELGEGGMGEVWLAEQQQPVRRKVALKIIKRGMDSKQVVARFEAERQALALMDHPAVAKVFDAGTTPRGRPFFVMEYVKGVPITAHCDRHRLSNRERLALFQRVCEGVQHAHQKAIIHRDLKPSNVLVTEQDGKRIPKIIDFGVAKATAQKLTERTMFTELGVLIGTPEYMSPEQAELTGEDVDTRTDVYSLGVMLYELLVGALPFDSKELRSGGFEGIRRKIREEEPHKPSTRLRTLGDCSTESAKCRRVDLPTLQRQLRGDLDWITMKALEKDRTRRYGAPMELAADIDRHLRHEPVLASPPSASYRIRKFIRRHRFGVGAAAVGVLLMLAFVVSMAVQTRRIAAERDRANREAQAKAQVSDFLKDLFSVSHPNRARGNSITARELLDRGAERIEDMLADQPEVRAELLRTVGNVYAGLGLFPEAASLLERTLAEHKRLLGNDHRQTLESMSELGELYRLQGRYAEAESLLLEVVEASKRLLGEDDVLTLSSMNRLGVAYRVLGRLAEAESLHREALEICKRTLGGNHPSTLTSLDGLGGVYWAQGRYAEAEPIALEQLKTRKSMFGEDHPSTLSNTILLAVLYSEQGRYDEAEPLFLEVLDTRKRVLGDVHPNTAESLYNLACLSALQGKRANAMAWMEQSVDAGWAGADLMAKDATLESLHGPEFDVLVERARQNAAATQR